MNAGMNAFWMLVCTELFLGGGGRWTAVGPVTLRFVLFGACLLAWAVLFVRDRSVDRSAQRVAFAFVGAYVVVTAIGAAQGAAAGVDVVDIGAEARQSLYWFAAPFIAVMVSRPGTVERTAKLVLYAGPVLAIGYFVVVAALYLGLIDFTSLWYWSYESEELVFRTQTAFVYKGFLYLGISLVFHLALRGRYWQPVVAMLFLAIVLTLTRGFVLSATVASLLLIALQRRALAILFVSVAAFASLVAMFWVFPMLDDSIGLSRAVSSGQRLDDMRFIAENAGFGTFVLGEGFGAMINFRPDIENTFLWAAWRFGAPGVAFWLAPLVLATLHFARIPRRSPGYPLACAYYFGLVCVYVQTATNPFLNNPIGLSYVLIALFSVRAIAVRHRGVRTRPARPRRGAVRGVARDGARHRPAVTIDLGPSRPARSDRSGRAAHR